MRCLSLPHNFRHGRAYVAVLADYVKHGRHKHFQFLRCAVFALVGQLKQKVLNVFVRYLVDVYFAELRQNIQRYEVVIAVVGR